MTIPRWLLPWLLPLTIVVALVAAAISFWLLTALVAAMLLGLGYLRLQSLNRDPPNPELRRRNFWDFR